MIEILTAILCIITAIYAYFNYQMATVMKDAYMSDHRPILAFRGLEIEQINITNYRNTGQTLPCACLYLKLSNVGKVPLQYSVNAFSASIGSSSVNQSDLLPTTIIIAPGCDDSFRSPGIPLQNNIPPIAGHLLFEFQYKAVGQTTAPFKTRRRLNIEIVCTNPLRLRYITEEQIEG